MSFFCCFEVLAMEPRPRYAKGAWATFWAEAVLIGWVIGVTIFHHHSLLSVLEPYYTDRGLAWGV